MRGGSAWPAGAQRRATDRGVATRTARIIGGRSDDVAVHGRATSLLRVRSSTCVAAEPLGENLQRPAPAARSPAGRPDCWCWPDPSRRVDVVANACKAKAAPGMGLSYVQMQMQMLAVSIAVC